MKKPFEVCRKVFSSQMKWKEVSTVVRLEAHFHHKRDQQALCKAIHKSISFFIQVRKSIEKKTKRKGKKRKG